MHDSVEERIARIRGEFRTVVTDPARGREFVAAQIQHLPRESEEHKSWLAVLPDAVEVIATDDPHSDSSFLKIFLLSDRKPIAFFFSVIHENDSRGLFARLQAALGEEVDVWPPDKQGRNCLLGWELNHDST
ncbi:MAG: hypothetical protein ACYTG0_15385 [Planctomycetota bacterium]|jgi:hypothetical protein